MAEKAKIPSKLVKFGSHSNLAVWCKRSQISKSLLKHVIFSFPDEHAPDFQAFTPACWICFLLLCTILMIFTTIHRLLPPSLALAGPLFLQHGAYRLEMISACSANAPARKQGLAARDYPPQILNSLPNMKSYYKHFKISSQIVYSPENILFLVKLRGAYRASRGRLGLLHTDCRNRPAHITHG